MNSILQHTSDSCVQLMLHDWLLCGDVSCRQTCEKNRIPIFIKMIWIHFRPNDFIDISANAQTAAMCRVACMCVFVCQKFIYFTCSHVKLCYTRTLARPRNECEKENKPLARNVIAAPSTERRNKIWSQNALFARWSSKCDMPEWIVRELRDSVMRLPFRKLELYTRTAAHQWHTILCVGLSVYMMYLHVLCAVSKPKLHKVQICTRIEHLMILSEYSTYSITERILHLLFYLFSSVRHNHDSWFVALPLTESVIRSIYLFIRIAHKK